jgi:hypothetical protein
LAGNGLLGTVVWEGKIFPATVLRDQGKARNCPKGKDKGKIEL